MLVEVSSHPRQIYSKETSHGYPWLGRPTHSTGEQVTSIHVRGGQFHSPGNISPGEEITGIKVRGGQVTPQATLPLENKSPVFMVGEASYTPIQRYRWGTSQQYPWWGKAALSPVKFTPGEPVTGIHVTGGQLLTRQIYTRGKVTCIHGRGGQLTPQATLPQGNK
jgi:hypothetical protein